MKAWGKEIACILMDNNTISKEETGIYAYLFDYLIENILFNGSVIVIGLLSGRVGIAFCYLLVTIPMRHYAGGFHAATRRTCTILSYGNFLFVLIVTPVVADLFHNEWLLAYGMGWLCILGVAPVDSSNKRLSKEQRKLLHKRCVMTCIIMSIIIVCLWYLHQDMYIATISVCVILDTIGLFAGIWKNRRMS